jgi:hypothetical protein
LSFSDEDDAKMSSRDDGAADHVKPPLREWEATNHGAAETGVHPRSLIRELNKMGADVLYWGGRRYNKKADRERVIRARIQRRNPPRRRLRCENQDTASA